MQYTILGKTGLKVSRLGFGCMRLPMENGRVVRKLSTPMLRRAYDLGVTYFDTAAGYCDGDSESALGDALKDVRDKIVLSTKNPHYDKRDEKAWWANLENSLRRLRTDHIDVYNFHGITWRLFSEQADGPGGELQWMLRAKEQGMIRHICFSFHDSAENLKKLGSTGYFDVVTLQYNLLDQANGEAFEHISKKCGMGIVVMGPVGGGRLGADSAEIRKLIPGAAHVPEIALRFVLANPCVSVALSGMQNMRQLEENVRTASRRTPLSVDEKRRVSATLARYKKLADLYCTGCNYCMPCPSSVNIPENFSALNYKRIYGLLDHARNSYRWLRGGQAAYCIACRKCMSKCPQGIDIVRQLRETARALDEAYGTVTARVTPTALKSFRPSGNCLRGILAARLDLRNMSDQAVNVDVAFNPAGNVTVKPQASAVKLPEFGRKTLQVKVGFSREIADPGIDTGVTVSGASKTETAGAFTLAFAAPRMRGRVQAMAAPVQILDGRRKLPVVVCLFSHDDKALRLSVDIVPFSKPGQTPADELRLWLDARPPATLGRPYLDGAVAQVGLSADPESKKLVRVARPRSLDPKTIRVRSRKTAGGVHIEAAIPWKSLNLDKAARRHLGMELILHSEAGAKTRDLSWTKSDVVGRPDKFGHLFLVARP